MTAIRVLVVDDSVVVRRLVTDALAADPRVEVVGTASDGRRALARVEQLKPDVVTMDLTMPEMDGIECIRRMLEVLPRTNILVVSALSDKSTAIQALRLGARGFVAKPFSDDELRLALLDVVEAR